MICPLIECLDPKVARNSAMICPLIECLDPKVISCSLSSIAHFDILPVYSWFDRTCFRGLSVRTCIGCAWKYLLNRLDDSSRVNTNFYIGGSRLAFGPCLVPQRVLTRLPPGMLPGTCHSSKSRWHIVLHGKRRIRGVDNVVDEDEYDWFDELPPFSDGVPPVDDDTVATTYLRSDHNEVLWIE
ncbi:hypothetical protein CTI12_AA135830 [Artemisia annua]|uniref:Uncharacterized protein n=1 Tax=Artemisia annua TaxID=35608 RepID=A0A2U1PHM7_ARTAN|nr:hypothetical protein CTI12_AA135830 [Artemisia annua]